MRVVRGAFKGLLLMSGLAAGLILVGIAALAASAVLGALRRPDDQAEGRVADAPEACYAIRVYRDAGDAGDLIRGTADELLDELATAEGAIHRIEADPFNAPPFLVALVARGLPLGWDRSIEGDFPKARDVRPATPHRPSLLKHRPDLALVGA